MMLLEQRFQSYWALAGYPPLSAKEITANEIYTQFCLLELEMFSTKNRWMMPAAKGVN